ncbi:MULTISPECIES: DEAD/DEAH box helicase [unclassified Legionella]|uniref:DEAD/DEAH box helicase n=1 Tax=unclassified Legionella TaxID=2622702 RepID=UPI001055B6EE|nr:MULTISPECIES: DEAD/DEAH box helicase [unclassified Legionella]MDI9817728.1 DEAD/DEAH box helicase [Legionella sp. PL877]
MLKEALTRMADVFLPTVLMHGQQYQQKGHVLNIRLSDGLLKARVKGHSSYIYDVHIDLKSWPGVPARCSCQYKLNCKHAAASLFSLQVRENYQIPLPDSQKSEGSLNSWLTTLREKEIKTVKDTTHEIIYLLAPHQAASNHQIIVQLAIVKRLKRGGVGKKTVFSTITTSRRQYFTSEDTEIVSALSLKNYSHGLLDRVAIRNSDLLQQILLTRRAYLSVDNEPGLVLGNPLPVTVTWDLTPQGIQYPVLKTNYNKEVLPLFLDKAWYFDKENNCLGLLDVPYSLGDLKKVFNFSSVSLEEAPLIASELALINPELPAPTVYQTRETRHIYPQAVIHFDAIELPKNADFFDDPLTKNNFLFTVDLFFEYADIRLAQGETSTSLKYREKNKLVEIPRNFPVEKEIDREITQLLNLRGPLIREKLWSDTSLDNKRILAHFHENDLPRFYRQVLPLLEKKKWKIEFAHYIYQELIDGEEIEWFSEVEERGNDFFSYQLGILIDGKQVSIVPLVVDLIGRMDKENIDTLPDKTPVKMPLSGGKMLQVQLGRIKPLIRFLLQYGTRYAKNKDHLQINRYQLILMQETEEAMAAVSTRWLGVQTIRQQLQQLATLSALPAVKSPPNLRATLRDYQHEGLNWLQFLRCSQFGGILADDMGLGKTIQTLAHLLVEKDQGRLGKASLIVAPTSLVGNWFEEARRFTPDLKVLIFHGAERHHDNFDDYDLVVSTYGLIQRDKSRFTEYPFYYLILDEAQCIKNARTKTTQIIQQIQARHRLCLSGTPLENHLGELWSLFNFLMPGLLGDAKQFRQFFKNPIEKQANVERKILLAKRVQPFVLRRTKNQVACELPAKTEMTRTIELTGTQRDLYEAIRLSMEKRVREAIARQGMEKSHILFLDALLKLRQVCCDPRLLSIPAAEIAYDNSAKLDTLMELLESLVDEGRRTLIFSQFTSMLKLIEGRLIEKNYSYLKLTGQTQNRQALVNSFQEGDIPVFLISLKAGGTGLNLTRADTVIHYDPWWNPAVEDQATDRSHRIGQENPVFVYKLITAGTVEEVILTMQEKKRQLFEGLFSVDAGKMMGLTSQDIEQFFMPLPP